MLFQKRGTLEVRENQSENADYFLKKARRYFFVNYYLLINESKQLTTYD